ncbi:MAG: hypothetical protein QW318_07180 [Candidatus Caldarchaeum sp.]
MAEWHEYTGLETKTINVKMRIKRVSLNGFVDAEPVSVTGVEGVEIVDKNGRRYLSAPKFKRTGPRQSRLSEIEKLLLQLMQQQQERGDK